MAVIIHAKGHAQSITNTPRRRRGFLSVISTASGPIGGMMSSTYSCLMASAGSAVAAFTAWQLTVNRAIRKAETEWSFCPFPSYHKDLEFRLEPSANSGVFVYNTSIEDWAPNTVEIQAPDDPAPKWAKVAPTWKCGAVFGHSVPLKPAVKAAGEWNRMTIRCQGVKIPVGRKKEIPIKYGNGEYNVHICQDRIFLPRPKGRIRPAKLEL